MLSRDSIETLSLEDRVKLQSRKTKGNEPQSSNRSPHHKKRANKNRPREMSSKIPSAGQPRVISLKSRSVDPRFDGIYGEYDDKEFKTNYGFVDDIRKKEMAALKRMSKKVKNVEKKQKINEVLKRMTDRERELEKVRILREKVALEKTKVLEALSQGKPGRFKSKSEFKLTELVNKFGALKEEGKLLKYMKKKTKSKPSIESLAGCSSSSK